MSFSPEDIQLEEENSRGRYVIKHPDGEEAELTYSRAGTSLIILDHTGVPAAFRGQGAGAALVARAVEDARKNGYKVMPLCPFAAAQFRRHSEWADVLKS